jgi:preprotein translocase subunit YajC
MNIYDNVAKIQENSKGKGMLNTLFSNLSLLQTGGQDSSSSLIITIGMVGLVLVVFYFLIIRPQNKRQKQVQTMLSALKKGDKVVTIGGMQGVVTAVKEQSVTLKVDESTKIEFQKSAIASVMDKKAPAVESK